MSNTEFIKVAFLDIDGTVRNRSLMETFVDFLYGLGYISRVVYEGLQAKRVQYKTNAMRPFRVHACRLSGFSIRPIKIIRIHTKNT